MKAVIWTKYGPPEVLQLRELEKPIPKGNEILIRIHASSVTAGDCEMRKLKLPLGLSLPMRLYAGWSHPKRIPILGQEISGIVEAIGKDVHTFSVGEEVFGTTGFKFGGYQEYICLPGNPENSLGILARKPKNLSFEEAATVPVAGFEALNFVRKGNVKPGDKVLIIGAGGSIGSFSIQLARELGAEVTAVDSGEKLDHLKSLGASQVIDYTKNDYTRSKERFDLVIDVVGRRSLLKRLQLLKPDGTYFLAFARISDMLLSILLKLTSKKKLKIESAAQNKVDLDYLTHLLEEGRLISVVDKTFPLEEIVEAHRYGESGDKKGNVAVSLT